MKLSTLLETTEYTLVRGTLDREVKDLIYDSRKAGEDVMFVCISGFRVDAHAFLADVALNGAAAVVMEKNWCDLSEVTRRTLVEKGVTVLQVADTRRALATLSAAWFGYPTKKMTVVGFTGTKGKTTSTHMLVSILKAAGRTPGLIGTNGVKYLDKFFPTRNTTPESYELQYHAANMLAEGVDCLVMEVSSQGLKLHRVDGIDFDYGVFLNLSPDHIGGDEHPDFEDYRDSKTMLFTRCREGILFKDDENFPAMAMRASCSVTSYGFDETADIRISAVRYDRQDDTLGCQVRLEGAETLEYFVGMPGLFNVYNATSAAVIALKMGIGADEIRRGLASARVDGRMEVVTGSEDFSVIVDYAHNGVSARTLLETLRSYKPSRLIVVFGCGGNRDPHRRYEMGEAVGRFADLSIVTSDNSRYEKVEDIIRDIHLGLDPTGGAFRDIPDRREAIRYAVLNARKGDMIAVIGKGHEDYQEIAGVRQHFLDREEIEAALAMRKAGAQEG